MTRAAISLGLILAVSLLLLGAAGPADASLRSTPEFTWMPEADVYAVVRAGNTVYIGGNFEYVGPPTSQFAVLDPADGTPDVTMPRVDGSIYALAGDGADGWYIGGTFQNVGGQPRQYFAHVLSDGTVDPDFAPDPDGFVEALAVSGDGATVYAGGNFGTIGGESHAGLAALDADGVPLPGWHADATSDDIGDPMFIDGLALIGSTLYAGGKFSTIGGESVTNLAAVAADDGTVDASFLPDPDGRIFTMAAGDSTVFVGGEFGSIGGTTQPFLAEIDADGNATAWDPVVDGTARSIAVGSDSAFVVWDGGLAEFDRASGDDTGWDPDVGFPSSVGYDEASNTVYVGAVVDGWDAVSAVDDGTGTTESWQQIATSYARNFVISGSTLAIGGEFDSIGGVKRNFAAAIDATTGEATDWDPHVSFNVNALALAGDTVYLGGEFNEVGGQPRTNLAAVDAATGALKSWNPVADGVVQTLVAADGVVYAGGLFDQVGGEAHPRLAEIEAESGDVFPDWNPNPDGPVFALAYANGVLYAGGSFSHVDGKPRKSLAAIGGSGHPTAWNPGTDAQVSALRLAGSQIYVGGNFDHVGTKARASIAAVGRAGTGTVSSWHPRIDGTVYALGVYDGSVYVGGSFGHVNGRDRPYLASIGATTGQVGAAGSEVDDDVNALSVANGKLFAGGRFETVNAETQFSLMSASTLPALRVSDVRVTEGNTGSKSIRFTVRLSRAWDQTVSVHYETARGSAHSPGDFAGRNGTLLFKPGKPLTKKVAVQVKGDLVNERNESFFLRLSNALHADIADARGKATIVDND